MRCKPIEIIGAVLAALVALCQAGCGPTSNLAEFRFKETRAVAGSTSVTWGDPTAIDLGAASVSNNDAQSTSCVGAVKALIANGSTLGCMQTPAVAYTASRWVVGFPMVNVAITPGLSIYSAITSIATGLFATPVVVDNALNLTNRYVRFAKLSSGDLVAVYFTETGAGFREVFGNIYSSSTGTWGNAVRLSTGGVDTDFSSDGLGAVSGTNEAVLCRPQVATAGDGSAMVSWCEGTGATVGQIAYRRYYNGLWTPAIGAAPNYAAAASSTLSFPGFIAYAGRFDQFDSDFNGTMDTTYTFTAGDSVVFRFKIAGLGYYVPVTIVTSTPAANQFKLVTSGATVLMRSTLTNMANGILAGTVYDTATNTAQTFKLSQLGFSMLVDPNCTDSACIDANKNVTVYYNRTVAEKYWDSGLIGGTYSVELPDNSLGMSFSPFKLCTVASGLNCTNAGAWTNFSPGSFNKNGNATNARFSNQSSRAYDWSKSAMVSIAGDGYGNYAMVRSTVMPYFLGTGIVDTAANVNYARGLVGQEYSVSLAGWKTVSPTSTVTFMKKVSNTPACVNSTDNQACSVRSPKILMSNSGKGLVLWNQWGPAAYDGTNFSNRLFFTTYSTGSSFSGFQTTLDDDTYCSTASTANDVPVCEASSFAKPCQALSESQNPNTPGLPTIYPVASTLDHDVNPIAAAMNADGTTIVGYTKVANSGTLTSPVCTFTGAFVKFWNPSTGLSSLTQLDLSVGNAMHVAVAINDKTAAAAAWEEVRGSQVYLYVRLYNSGSWGTAKLIDSAYTITTESLMPGIEINSSGDAVVTWSKGIAATGRRQYSAKYTAGST